LPSDRDSALSPLSLRDDPLAYINRMVAAYDANDRSTFRHLTQVAANDPYARLVQTAAAAHVDREDQDQSMRQRLGEQQRNEQAPQASLSAVMARSI
jgi:hypothetical protein